MPTISKRTNSDGSTSWMAQVRLKGFKPVGRAFPKQHDAKEWAKALDAELRRQRERGGVRDDVAKLTLAQLSREFLADPETQQLRTHQGLSDLMAWWVNHHGAERCMRFNVIKLRESRLTLSRGRAPATVNRYLSALRSCWNWGRAAGLIPQDLLWPSRLLLTEPEGRKRFLSDPELQRLLEAAEHHSPSLHAAVLISIACGVRQSELRRLKWSDVDLERQRLRVMLSKNNESRTVYLPKAAADALRTLKRAPVVGQQIFINADGKGITKDWLIHRWNAVRTAAELQNFHWHDLRHSCASFLAQQGATLLEIGSVLGHKSPSVTQRYAHLIEGAPVTGHTALDEKLSGKK